MHTSLPAIHVLPTRFDRGANDLENLEGLVAAELLPLEEALMRHWPSDAHLVQYGLWPDDSPDMPRLNKVVLPHVRVRGGDVACSILAVEYDCPGHAALTLPAAEALAAALSTLPAPLDQWTAFYTTRNGARLIYVLSHSVLVEEFEGVHAGVVRDLRRCGFAATDDVGDWTRTFRLPSVERRNDDNSTSDTRLEPLHELVVRPQFRLDPASILPVKIERIIGVALDAADLVVGPAPEDVATRALIFLEEGKPTPWHVEARKRLRGRECFAPLFEQAQFAKPGNRTNRIQSLVGEAAAVLRHLPGTGEVLLYALFLEPILALEPDAQTPDWRDPLWLACRKWWAVESKKLALERAAEAVRAVTQETVMERIVKGMRRWCDAPALHESDESAAHFAAKHLFACTETQVHVMRPDGMYDPVGVSQRLVLSRARAVGLDTLVPLEEIEASGRKRSLTAQQLIDHHGTVARYVEGVVGTPGLFGASIRNLGSERATLSVPMYWRRDELEPKYDKEVAAWLQALAGDERLPLLERWIACALAFEDGPTCALSVCGSPGIGKKMLVQGLAECVSTEVVADGAELFAEYQTFVMRTPFFVVDEGFPKKVGGGRDPADTFRHMVAGDPISVNQKYIARLEVRNPLRLIFTANNLDVVGTLTAGRDLSPDDRAALAQRLLHLDCTDDAAILLRQRGGLAWTSSPGRRWVRRDNGQKSDYIVARHFMHLYATRKEVPAGNRLLMEGSLTPQLLRIVAMRSGSGPLVVEVLVRLIENARSVNAPEGVRITDEGQIIVTVAAVVDGFRKDIGRLTRREIDARQVASVLRGLMRKAPDMRAIEIGNLGKGTKVARWYEIDPHTLLEEAQEFGWSSRVLSELAAKAPRRLAQADRFVRSVEREMGRQSTAVAG